MIASMAQPVLLAVDRDSQVLEALERDITRRFKADYRVVTAATPEAALTELGADDEVAVIIAGQWLVGTSGVDFRYGLPSATSGRKAATAHHLR